MASDTVRTSVKEHDRSPKSMAEKVLLPLDDKVNRNAKDSIFVDLFDRPEYLFQLYKVLHPEDTESKEEDPTIVTLESLLLKQRYNDLGFIVGNRLMILVEAQSTWSPNIVVRFLLYIADTYNRYIEKNDLDLYTTKKIQLPVPELYVVYTGKESHPDTIRLSSDIFGVDHCSLEVEAKVIRESTEGDILDQYIEFTHIFDEQIKLYGRTRKAVEETLLICRDRMVLYPYFEGEEVANIMFTFVDKEKQLARLMNEEREEEREEGRVEGIDQSRIEGIKSLMNTLTMTAQESMEALSIPLSEQSRYLSKL